MEQLEPRLLLSAGVAGVVMSTDVMGFADPDPPADLPALADSVAPVFDVPSTARELVIIDPHTPDYRVLIDGLKDIPGRTFEVLVLDAGDSGIAQISRALSGQQALTAVHIISHSGDGRIQLGNNWLDNDSLQTHKTAIAAWGSALDNDGDLLIYGCNLAAGGEGQQLLQALQALTGADIAASDDLTGNAALGGDWDLEYKTGAIETSIAFRNDVRQNWNYALATETVLDQFTVNGDFNQNNGTRNWSGAWTEVNASNPDATISGGVFESARAMSSDTTTDYYRVADLTGASSATFTFDVTAKGFGFNSADNFVVYASNDGGSSWTALATIAGDAAVGAYSYDVASYIASNTAIRFDINHAGGGPRLTDWIQFDNVQIQYVTNADPVVGNVNTDTLAYSEGDGAVVIDQGIVASVTDSDGGNFDTGSLTVSFASGSTSGEDVLAIQNQGTGPGQIGVSGSNVTYAGSVIGAYSGGSNGADLVITFNSTTYSTPAAAAELINAITFENTNTDNPDTTSRSVTYVISDGDGGTSNTSTATVNVTAVNDAPVVNDQTFAVDENSANSTSVGTVLATDVDVADTLTYSIIAGNASGAFAINVTSGEITVADGSQLNFETTPSFGLTVQVTDDGTGTLFDTATVTINLNDINEAPTAANNTVITNEDTTYTFVAGDFGFNDVDVGNILTSVQVTSLGAVGTLQLSGADVTLNQVISAADIAAGNLTFVPVANGNGAPYDSFSFSVNDGALDSAGSYTMSVDVIAVNDAPMVNDQTFTVDENSANSASVGTVLATDADTSDTLTYSITAGNASGVFAINAVTGEITVADSSLLNFETTPSYGLTVQVQDDSAGLLTDTAAITINLNDINEAPVVNDQALSVAAGSINGAVVGTLAASDPDSGDTLTYSITADDLHAPSDFAIDAVTGEITINDNSNLGANGSVHTLTVQVQDDGTGALIDTATVTVNVVTGVNAPTIDNVTQILSPVPEDTANGTLVSDVDASDLDGDTLTYSITAGNTGNAFSINSTTGEISVNDSNALDFEGAPVYNLAVEVSDGALTDSTAVTINLSNVNEAPVVNDQTFTVDENSANSTSVGTVLASDVDAADTLTYSIIAGNASGAFAIDAVTGEITVADTAELDFETTPSFGLTVQVADDGTGTLFETATVTINLNDINEAPTAANNTVVTNEDTTYTFVAGDFGFSDVDTGDILASVQITTLETVGALQLSGADVTLNQVISAADIAAGNLTFVPVADANGAPYDSFGFSVNDGALDSAGSYTMSVDVTAVNDAPVVNDQIFAVDENSSNGSVVGTVLATDVDAGDTLSYSIIAGNASGAFAIDAVTGEITVNDVTRLDFETTPSFGLTVQVEDDGTGLLTDTATVTINLNDLNEAPTAANNTVIINEDSTYTFVAGDFGFSDVDAGNILTSVQITTLETVGALQLSGIDVTLNQVISAADIAAGNLTFVPVADANGAPYDSFGFSVNDGALDSTSSTMTVTVTAVNDAPVVNDQTFAVDENSANGTSVGTVLASDVDAADTLTYSIIAGNASGAFAINASSGEITVADGSQLNFEGTPSFGLTVQVTDDGTGTLFDTVTVTINLNDINEAPTAANNTVITNEDTTYTFVAGDFGFSDVDAGNILTSVQVTSLETVGALQLSGTDVTLNQVISAADIAAGNLTFVPVADANGAPYDSFGFSVNDGALDSTSSYTMSVDVTAVNDAPVVNDQTFAVDENSANGTVVGTVVASDQDAADTLTYSIIAGNDNGTFAINSATGEITVNDSKRLDFEISPSFSLTLQITDAAGDNVNGIITITLNDLGDTPVPMQSANTVSGAPLPPPLVPEPGLVNTPPVVQVSLLALEPFIFTGGGGSHGNLGVSTTIAEPAPAPEPVAQTGTPESLSPDNVRATEQVGVSLKTKMLADNEVLQHDVGTNKPSDALWLSLERMNNEMDGSRIAHPWLMAATRGMVWTFSAGFLAWMLRAGSLLATVLSSMPMWRWIDPLPILPVKRRERDKRKKKMRAEAEQEAKVYSGMAAVLDGVGDKAGKTSSGEGGRS